MTPETAFLLQKQLKTYKQILKRKLPAAKKETAAWNSAAASSAVNICTASTPELARKREGTGSQQLSVSSGVFWNCNVVRNRIRLPSITCRTTGTVRQQFPLSSQPIKDYSEHDDFLQMAE
ncbi:MAG: hypothetical protein SGI83_04090 [Bacteroidota bacterium]|nr:hypothetical protein [Bacteroidota bacterium]